MYFKDLCNMLAMPYIYQIQDSRLWALDELWDLEDWYSNMPKSNSISKYASTPNDDYDYLSDIWHSAMRDTH